MSVAVRIRGLSFWYPDPSGKGRGFRALRGIDLDVEDRTITALIGPSGCGKSTLLKCLNRMNERAGAVHIEGTIELHGHDVFGPEVALEELRRQVGMVFQRPNPLPLSIADNVLFGHRLHLPRRARRRSEEAELVERALRRVHLFEDVKDRLDRDARSLSLEAQQKLCIARLLPLEPKLILLDEPCSALDPRGTEAVEALMRELVADYTLVIVTHSMAQARRVSSAAVFMLLGEIAEAGETERLFGAPRDPRTADYVAGRYA